VNLYSTSPKWPTYLLDFNNKANAISRNGERLFDDWPVPDENFNRFSLSFLRLYNSNRVSLFNGDAFLHHIDPSLLFRRGQLPQ